MDITTAMIKQFGGNLELLVQQKGSVIGDKVRLETGVVGEDAYFDQLAPTAAVRKTVRNSDTPLVKSDHRRRRVSMYDYEWADLIDKEDKAKTLVNPDNEYVTNAAFALGRSKDDAIIASALATAATGKDGSTAASFDTTNFQIVHGSVGLTVAKILSAKKKLDKALNDPSEERFFLCDAAQIADLLAINQVTSTDYANIKALVEGRVDTFSGFKFQMINRLQLSSTTRSCLAYTKSSLLLAIGMDIKTEIDRIPGKSYSTQVYASMGIGSTRMREDGLVEVQCTES